MSEFSYLDFINWAKEKLPGWQLDALRRVVEKPPVSTDDIAELAAMALAPYVENSSAPKPVPPSGGTELSGNSHPCVQLAALRNIERVNALAPGPLVLVPGGLTVIYGPNASGKSGFARILKRACHARDSGGTVLPNVFEVDPKQPASARIDFVADGVPRSHDWIDGSPKDPVLHLVNVFDLRCAAVQVEKANRISYTPEILQIFRSLATVIVRVEDALKIQKNALGNRSPSIAALLSLDSDTEPGRFMAGLSSTSPIGVLGRLCSLTQREKQRIEELERALTVDPIRQAVAEEARAQLVQNLIAAVAYATQVLSDRECSAFEKRLEERNTTREAAKAARIVFSESSDLSGVGTRAWRALWESSRTYSETHAYVGESFPVFREEAVCVLCHQQLSPKARARLRSLEEFVKADVQQKADRAAAMMEEAANTIHSLKLPSSVTRDLRMAGVLDTPEGKAARAFLVLAKLRRKQLLRRLTGHAAGDRPTLPDVPHLAVVLQGILNEAKRLRLASRTSERQEMEREYADLKARETLSPHRETVQAEILRLKKIAELDRAIDLCKTQPITLKRREVAESVLTDRLRTSFEENLRRLGFSESPVEVKLGAGDHGEHPFEMKLKDRPEVRPEEILSEGERTCVALAGLLAELDTTGNRAALVLDDPVSSLDDQFRKHVAERLTDEAKHRQVIVFTHDVAFLYLLRKYQAELDIPMNETSIERGYKGNHGQAKEGPPWVAMRVKNRVKALREELLEARRILREQRVGEYNRRASGIYGRLRMSWERAVEEVLLNGTVLRFGDSVETKRLAKLTDITEDDIQRVKREMSRCSDFTHDEPRVIRADPPGPDVIEYDIRKLDDWITALRKQRGRQ